MRIFLVLAIACALCIELRAGRAAYADTDSGLFEVSPETAAATAAPGVGLFTVAPLPEVAEGAELGLLDQVWGAARGGKYREAAGLLLFLFLGMVGRYWTVIPWKKIWDPLSDRQRTWAVMAMAMAASAAVTLPGNVPLETVLENGLVAGAVAVAAWHSGGKDVFAKLAAWKAARKAAKASSAEPPGPAASSSR